MYETVKVARERRNCATTMEILHGEEVGIGIEPSCIGGKDQCLHRPDKTEELPFFPPGSITSP